MSRTGCTLLLFWDYDTKWGADRSRSKGGPKDWGHLEFTNTERLLEILAEYRVRVCFAVVGAAALPGARPYHDPKQIRAISEAGHEVASHSFRHEWLPGLGRQLLLETLKNSKDALEQCIGAPVISFVPPFNQPFDYARRWSFSLSERIEARHERTDLVTLCKALSETGFRFCRVAYRPLSVRIAESLSRRRLDRVQHLEQIEGVWCARINAPCGFGQGTTRMLETCGKSPGILTVYGHPHSLTLPGLQNFQYFLPFVTEVNKLRSEGRIKISNPADLVEQSYLHEGLCSLV